MVSTSSPRYSLFILHQAGSMILHRICHRRTPRTLPLAWMFTQTRPISQILLGYRCSICSHILMVKGVQASSWMGSRQLKGFFKTIQKLIGLCHKWTSCPTPAATMASPYNLNKQCQFFATTGKVASYLKYAGTMLIELHLPRRV